MLDEVQRACKETGKPIQCIQKLSEKADDVPGIMFTTDNAAIFSTLGPDCKVAGGTSWLWARPEAFETLGVLFVDEAAQMSLANVLAVSHAAKTIVLLGDPRQLEQPMQGSHPEGTDVSALKHILANTRPLPLIAVSSLRKRGDFTRKSARSHLSYFTKTAAFESGSGEAAINSTGRVNGSGLRYLPVDHAEIKVPAPKKPKSSGIGRGNSRFESNLDRAGRERSPSNYGMWTLAKLAHRLELEVFTAAKSCSSESGKTACGV